MEPHEWRSKVGVPIERRRQEIGLRSMRAAAATAGISEAVWRQVERGKRQLVPGTVVTPTPNSETRAAIARALFWPIDAIERLEAGDDPSKFPTTKYGTARLAIGAEQGEPVEVSASGDLDELRETDPEAYAAVNDLIQLHLERARQRRR